MRIPASLLVVLASVLVTSCATSQKREASSPPESKPMLDTSRVEAELLEVHGEAQRERIERGLKQVASLWREEDGDLAAFARANFLSDPGLLDATRTRLEHTLEQIEGHSLEIGRFARWATEVDVGPILPVDELLATYDPSAHITEDLFNSKIAFVALLNWPLTDLQQRTENARTWSRDEWAEVRLTGRFARRVPGSVQQQITKAAAESDFYIANYNLWMHHVLGEDGARIFPKGKRLISHWNLRDELKAAYASGGEGLARQRTIVKVMERIVTQTIPGAVIDNPRLDWNPFTNEVALAPADTVEAEAPAKASLNTTGEREEDVRYAKLLAAFHAQQQADPYSPTAPTFIARTFELGRELPEERVVALLTEILSSPRVKEVAALAQKKLGRPLEPQDLWFDGFKPRSAIPEAELDALTKKRYPTADAFARDIPRILSALGFSPQRARFVAEHIRVDPSRGAGHAMPAARRGDFPRLRTRVGRDGMDYKGYNIAVHELGHNVEQVFSLYEVDHTLLAGVPNNAFTEALAFVFQARDLELLGMKKADAEAEKLRVLGDFWSTWEMAGVSLLDLEVWRWMYAHPDATPAQLREATVSLARELWKKHYAPVLGGDEVALLGIYSHMISYPLYLADYPLGSMIARQLEAHFATTRDFGAEFERIASHGMVTPDAWMIHATGEPVSAGPMLRAVEAALK